MHLPVDDVLDDVRAALDRERCFVLQAPPGAGKTTRVPPALLAATWRDGRRILVLEPRRLAARAAAQHMARERGEEVGRSIGFSTRDERRVSDATAIEVVTEGILVRRLQRDPSLAGTAAVLFDEFHERNLAADLGLALTLDVSGALRPDLRIGVMSATLAATRVASLLGDAPVVTSEGRRYPVETHYLPRPVSQRVEDATVAAVELALEETEGDLLVFLPGAGEIRRVERDLAPGPGVAVTPLFGALPPQDQDRALVPAPAGTRKVVLATDIAETSLTIGGVRVVIDSGLTREPRFDPGTAMSRLETVRISRASAEQRRGRAGRTAPGVCYRLWARREDAGLAPHRLPELAQVDLAGFALELAGWGVGDPAELAFLDQPPDRAYEQAVELLTDLEALDGEGRITDHGRELLSLPVHPRLAHAVVGARDRGMGSLGCEVAALLADRDVLTTGRHGSHADLASRVRLLRGQRAPRGTSVRGGALARARRERDRLRSAIAATGGGRSGGDVERVGEVIALAYPDRVARQRGRRGSYLLANGRGASLPETDPLAGEEWLVVAAAGGIGGAGEARIHLAAPIDVDRLREVLGPAMSTEEKVAWDDDSGDVIAEERLRLGALVLDRGPIDPVAGAVTDALLEGVRSRGLDLLPWTRELRGLLSRLQFLHRTMGEPWPDMSEERLLAELDTWLAPYLASARRARDLAQVPLRDALLGRVGWQRARQVDELAPSHVEVPSGARVRLAYDGDVPVLAVRVQQAFGWTETPRVAGGRVRVMVHLLSPAHRPVQVTQDLAGFWERGYPEVRAELRGRYPKHPWPEDPLEAEPTNRAKPR